MAAYKYKGHLIVEMKGHPRSFSVHGYYGTFPTVKAAKDAIDKKES